MGEEMVCGGASAAKEPDDEVKTVVSQVWSNVSAACNEKELPDFDQVQVLSFKTQVVAGTNFFVQVKIGEGETDYLFLRIYRGFDGQCELAGVQADKTADDQID